MIVTGVDLQNVYQALKADTYSSEDKGVQVFVSATDADSAAALQLLMVSFALMLHLCLPGIA
jgi:hypothetical protein